MAILIKRSKKKCINKVLALAVSALFSPVAWPIADGEMVPDGQTHVFEFDIGINDLKSNTVGSLFSKEWDLSSFYSAYVYCTTPIPARGEGWFSTTTDMIPSRTPGYLYFNEYLDVAVEVWIEGNTKAYKKVPFTDETNGGANTFTGCRPPRTLQQIISSGSKGRLTFIIAKPLINGINLNTAKLVDVYGRSRLTSPSDYTMPLSRVIIKTGIITVPDKCEVNGGAPISVEFGPVGSTSAQLNGENYKKPLALDVACKGGSFDAGPLNIKMALQTTGAGVASFNPDYLGTTGTVDRKDLGIIVRNKANLVIKPDSFHDLDSFNVNRGRWDLTVAPIAKPGADIPEGEFHSSATIVAQFQ